MTVSKSKVTADSQAAKSNMGIKVDLSNLHRNTVGYANDKIMYKSLERLSS